MKITDEATTMRDEVFEVYGRSLRSDRSVVYPDAEGVDLLVELVGEEKKTNRYVALVDGAFDVPHPNHEWYLRHCKMLAAKGYAERNGYSQDPSDLRMIMGSQAIFLVVTVDADVKVAAKKGNVTEKGGVARPIYPWKARAERIAGYAYDSGHGRDYLLPVVDLVTVEGDPIHQNTPLESSLTFARHLKSLGLLDMLVMFGEHDGTIKEAYEQGLEPTTIPESIAYELNTLTGKNWKSSDIIRRAQGK